MAKKAKIEVKEEGAVISDAAVESIAAPKAEKKQSPDDLIKIQIPVYLKIKRREFHPGIHVVERHMLDTIREMVDKKTRADLSIFVGKNYLVERVAGNTLKVTEVEKL